MPLDIRLNTDYTVDENLREVPDELAEMERAVDYLTTLLIRADSPARLLVILGPLGSYCRVLMRLDEAVSHHMLALQIAGETEDDRARIANLIRLATAYQWQGRFGDADVPYNRVLSECEAREDLAGYIACACQHAGESQFEQGDCDLAVEYFQVALARREAANAPAEQIESSRLALETARKRLG